MASKRWCVNCGNPQGLFESGYIFSDGEWGCSSCLKRAGLDLFVLSAGDISSKNFVRMANGLKPLTPEDELYKKYRDENFYKVNWFKGTHQVDIIKENKHSAKTIHLIRFNDETEEFVVGEGDTGDLFKYENILDFELIQNGTAIISGTSGRSAIGGALFGTTGAIVGASGSRNNQEHCLDLSVKLILKDTYRKDCYIQFINRWENIYTDSFEYEKRFELAQKCLTYLRLAQNVKFEKEERERKLKEYRARANHVTETAENSPKVSEADELRKFKQLLDDGIITQEEFNAKKKQIFGI